MALDMLRAQPSRTRSSPEETEASVQKDDVAIVPLAIPLLAGPGTVASIMVYSTKHSDILSLLILTGILVVCCLIVWGVFVASEPISRIISPSSISIFERIGLVSGILVFALAPEAEGHGTDAAIDAYHRRDGLIRTRVPFVKTLA